VKAGKAAMEWARRRQLNAKTANNASRRKL
jgi:hypothetical protein